MTEDPVNPVQTAGSQQNHEDENPPADPDRMSGFEALMWELERSPLLGNAFTNLTVLDRPPERRMLRARMERAVSRVPRLRQCATPAPGRLTTPAWVEDPDFDLDHHLRWVDLGGRATDREVEDFVCAFSAQPFDRGRPLWDYVVIEGIAGGRGAMAQRMHHTITDGEGGIKLSVEFLDLERNPTPPEAADDPEGHDPQNGSDAKGPSKETADDPVSPDWSATLGDSMRQAGEQMASAMTGLTNSILRPGEAVENLRSTAKQIPTSSRLSPIWEERSTGRWFGTTLLDLAEVKNAAHQLGGSVNDFFVCGAAAGAGSYHRLHGSPVEQLRLSMPVSTRSKDSSDDDMGGNSFSPTTALVATGDTDPADRFRTIHETLAETKAEGVGSMDGAANVMNLLPSAAIAAAGERIAAAVDFVCSNVRAAPFDLYIGGALIEANYPLGPLGGTAFNLTTMSYRGEMFIGLVVDTAAVDEPGELLAQIAIAYEELFAAANA